MYDSLYCFFSERSQRYIFFTCYTHVPVLKYNPKQIFNVCGDSFITIIFFLLIVHGREDQGTTGETAKLNLSKVNEVQLPALLNLTNYHIINHLFNLYQNISVKFFFYVTVLLCNVCWNKT